MFFLFVLCFCVEFKRNTKYVFIGLLIQTFSVGTHFIQYHVVRQQKNTNFGGFYCLFVFYKTITFNCCPNMKIAYLTTSELFFRNMDSI